MATDLHFIAMNLCDFYDFNRKFVIAVGAGNGRLIEYARRARFVVAVDRDEAAINCLRRHVRNEGLSARFFMFVGGITSVPFQADVVLFEFSLHDTSDPRAALQHARRLAPEMVIIDHAAGSPWSWFAGEDRGVAECWAAVPPTAVTRERTCEGIQRFGDYMDVKIQLRNQGATSQARIVELQHAAPIAIPMPFRLALVDSHSVG